MEEGEMEENDRNELDVEDLEPAPRFNPFVRGTQKQISHNRSQYMATVLTHAANALKHDIRLLVSRHFVR
jgi:hypothetical protein